MSDMEREVITEAVEAIKALDESGKQFVLGFAAGVAAASAERKAS